MILLRHAGTSISAPCEDMYVAAAIAAGTAFTIFAFSMSLAAVPDALWPGDFDRG
jgi:hypothetical protein